MSMYKACDIRGVYGNELTEAEALHIGKAIGTFIGGAPLVVGGDTRFSTDPLKRSLIEGLLSTGSDVTDIGTVPTPVTYFAKNVLNAQGAVMVTASHNPAQYNGFKLLIADTPVKEEDIIRIRELVESRQFLTGKGVYTNVKVLPSYLQMILSSSTMRRKLKVVLDCGNGAASVVALQIFEEIGYEVVPLFCEPLGTFPHRDPNPSVEEHLSALKEKVVQEKADIGIAFDGDGDRVVFVDDTGRFCDGEAIFLLLVNQALSTSANAKIVYDGKSSSIVHKGILEHGGIAIPERSGHAFIRRRFLEEQAVLAGEVSGHYFFSELGHDDGLYAAVRVCSILSEGNQSLSTWIDSVETPLITPDIRLYLDTQTRKSILARVSEKGSLYRLSYLDGVRVDTPHGWVVARNSVTEPCVTVRMEADSLETGKNLAREIFEDYPEVCKRIELALVERNRKKTGIR
ncbi:MAG: phosphomannomutase/phosphoglucomutase [Sphaerochaetaceae bacterium]|nr:phosphomannomutase/phosphoglucomutase [Sphaerochaetaceae bacterium]